MAPLSPAVPADGDVIAKRGRTSGGRAVETHVATADRTELTTLVPRWPLNRVAVEWPPVGNEVCRSGATTGTHRAVAVARHGTHRYLTSAEMRPAIGGTAVLRCGSNPLTPNGIRSPSASGWAATPSVPVRSLAGSPA